MSVSRRDLFRGGTLLAAGAVATAGLGMVGCAPSSKEADTKTDQGEWDQETSVLVVGSGLSGLSAAIQLRQMGIATLLVDKGSSLGLLSNSCVSGGTFCRPRSDDEESKSTFMEAWMKVSQNEGDAELTRLVAESINEDIAWLEELGCQFNEPADVANYDIVQVTASPGLMQGMGPLINTLVSQYDSLDGESLTDAKLINFVLDDAGAVAGARFRTSQGYLTVKADATILATGTYIASSELCETFIGPEAAGLLVRGQTTQVGDGIIAARNIGAGLHGMAGLETLHYTLCSPVSPSSTAVSAAIPFCVVVNTSGQRFVDEGSGYVAVSKAAFKQPQGKASLICDAGTVSSSEKLAGEIDRYEGLGMDVVKADTLESLAEQCGLPVDAFVATIGEYNAACDGGATTGLAINKSAQASKVDTAPFYAIPNLQVGSMAGFGGLMVDETCQVFEADGTAIKGLYAAGMTIGGLFKHNYIAGASLDCCVVTGRAAAESAASVVKA